MKLLICTNFAQPFHTGGAERVVQQITESMVQDENFSCTVFCQYGSSPKIFNGVNVVPVGNLSESQFVNKIIEENPDHLFIYSDWFFMWPAILKNLDKLAMKKSIGLVGMNRMRSLIPSNKIVADLFIKNHQHFKVLAHAESYIDFIVCKKLGIPVTVIHNAINLKEFIKSDFDFKKHYGINSEKMLLCVSNFFPGKGQEFLVPIISKLREKNKDFTFVFISSTLAFEPGNRLRKTIKDSCERMNLPVKFLNDIPRDHVVQSYFACDAFVFPSQQECGPIVVLEAMAAKKPWVSTNVGHIKELEGGLTVGDLPPNGEMLKFKNNEFYSFCLYIQDLLDNKESRISLGNIGRVKIENDYNWEKIKKQYSLFFK